MTQAVPLCKNCKHSDMFGPEKGKCVRYPPQAMTIGGGQGPRTEWGFPEIRAYFHCGEWADEDEGPKL